MGQRVAFNLWLLILSCLAGCQSVEPTVAPPIETAVIAAQATINPLCAAVDAYWNQDWAAVLNALDQLVAVGQTCGEQPLGSKQYAAHFNYAVVLEGNGDMAEAINHYRLAFLLNPRRNEALNALTRLNALPEPTQPSCLTEATPLTDPTPEREPEGQQFVQVEGDQLRLEGHPFIVRGVNYFPRFAPWHRFLEQANPADMAAELDLIQQAGFNTIRVFLWYDALFTCRPEDAIPNEAAFVRVDALFQLARERNLKLIVTLNDLPDLVFRPLYMDWARYDAQTIYIVRRYHHEPAILAWDLRNEGDLDYGARLGDEARFSQEEVLGWLAHITQVVRANDPYHLITVGWWGDPTATSPYVDILSFHHWEGVMALRLRVATYPKDKPLLLQEVGYHSWSAAPQDARNEQEQAELLLQVVATAEVEGLAGWLVWTAFDFAPEPGESPSHELFFGLWRLDLTPKPALELLPAE